MLGPTYKKVFVPTNFQYHLRCETRRSFRLNRVRKFLTMELDYKILVQRHSNDFWDKSSDELQSLKSIYSADFGEKTLSPWDLLDSIETSNRKTLFPNLNVAFRILSTIPATVASVQCPLYSVSKIIKNVLPYDRVKMDYQAWECR